MTATDLLTTLRHHGAVIYLKDGALRLNRPKDFPAELIEQARIHRAELLAMLAAQVPSPRARRLSPRERLWASVGDEGLVGRYGAAVAGELMRLVQDYEDAHKRGHDSRRALAQAFDEAMRRAEASPLLPAQPAHRARRKPREALRAKPAAPSPSAIAEAPSWPVKHAGLVEYVLGLAPEDLRSAPWSLRPGVTVRGNARFLASLQSDISQGPAGPRARTGALQQDMADVVQLIAMRRTRHMGEVIRFPRRMPKGGGCPRCGLNQGYLNDGPDHWFVCFRHGLKWYGGRNVMRDWKQENEDFWRYNREMLAEMKEVKPRDWKQWHRP